MNIFQSGFDKLGAALDVFSAQHTVTASNIANIDTPGYKAKTIDFKDAFADSLKRSGLGMRRTRGLHLSGSTLSGSPTAHVKEQINNFMRNDGNNVNIDSEMMALSKNNLMYNMTAQLLGNRFNIIKYAISEGRRA